MRIVVLKSEFEAPENSGLIGFVLEGEVHPATPLQHDLLDFIFQNGEQKLSVNSEAGKNPTLQLAVFIKESQWKAELQRREDAKNPPAEVASQPAAPQPEGTQGSSPLSDPLPADISGSEPDKNN